jgi:alkaline phosphatase
MRRKRYTNIVSNYISTSKNLLSFACSELQTYSLNEQTPDSAATASALFSGVKTQSTTMGFDSSIVPKDASSMLTATQVETVLTWAQEAHKKTGNVLKVLYKPVSFHVLGLMLFYATMT